MVINEKALLNAMKVAYKHEGYNVARRESSVGDILMIQTPEWAVEIIWKNIPNKILALIVEHIQDIPQPGNAFTARKKEAATILYSMLDELDEIGKDDKWPKVRRVPITYEGYEVWQTEDKTCFLVQHNGSAIPKDHGRDVYMFDGEIYICGAASKVAIRPRKFLETKPEYAAAQYLSGKKW